MAVFIVIENSKSYFTYLSLKPENNIFWKLVRSLLFVNLKVFEYVSYFL